MRRNRAAHHAAAVLLLFATAFPAAAQKHAKEKEKEQAASLPAEIWHDPGDVANLNLIYGAGGQEDAPDPNGTYKFIGEDLKGTSPKFDVEDEHGNKWRVKMGQEPQAETAATRLLWAAGYYEDEDYYLPEIRVDGLPKLRRGRKFVTGTVVHRVRLKLRRKDIQKLGDWDWFNNPFVGARQLNGLRVMMALVNNWDVNPDNNSIYEVRGEREYLVTDVGATFGRTGNALQRSKSRLRDYEHAPFIAKVTPDDVDFVFHTRSILLRFTHRRSYVQHKEWENVAKHIPRADAQWIGQMLARLSDIEVRQCFEAAGCTPEQVDGYTKTLEKRIEELNAL